MSNGSKAARQVRGWMDVYAFDVDAFAALVSGVAGCSEEAVVEAMLSDRQPPFAIARAIEGVTAVDARDWFILERPRAEATAAPDDLARVA